MLQTFEILGPLALAIEGSLSRLFWYMDRHGQCGSPALNFNESHLGGFAHRRVQGAGRLALARRA